MSWWQFHRSETPVQEELRPNHARPCLAARDALAGRNPPHSRFTEVLRLRELMWIASAFVFLDWYYLPSNFSSRLSNSE
jgi:hypothetical protein